MSHPNPVMKIEVDPNRNIRRLIFNIRQSNKILANQSQRSAIKPHFSTRNRNSRGRLTKHTSLSIQTRYNSSLAATDRMGNVHPTWTTIWANAATAKAAKARYATKPPTSKQTHQEGQA